MKSDETREEQLAQFLMKISEDLKIFDLVEIVGSKWSNIQNTWCYIIQYFSEWLAAFLCLKSFCKNKSDIQFIYF